MKCSNCGKNNSFKAKVCSGCNLGTLHDKLVRVCTLLGALLGIVLGAIAGNVLSEGEFMGILLGGSLGVPAGAVIGYSLVPNRRNRLSPPEPPEQ